MLVINRKIRAESRWDGRTVEEWTVQAKGKTQNEVVENIIKATNELIETNLAIKWNLANGRRIVPEQVKITDIFHGCFDSSCTGSICEKE